MKFFRRIAIQVINVIVLLWLTKVFFLDGSTDVFGLFFILTLLFLIVYNIYAVVLYNIFFKNANHFYYIEVGFLILLSLPIALLWYFTS